MVAMKDKRLAGMMGIKSVVSLVERMGQMRAVMWVASLDETMVAMKVAMKDKRLVLDWAAYLEKCLVKKMVEH